MILKSNDVSNQRKSKGFLFTLKKFWQSLLVALAQVKVRNHLQNLLNKI